MQQLQKLRKTADRNRYLTNRNRVLVRKIKDTADQLADAEAELASAKKEHAEHEEAQDESIRNLEKALQRKAIPSRQSRHLLTPPGEEVPAAQMSQDAALVELEYLPGGQGTHAVSFLK